MSAPEPAAAARPDESSNSQNGEPAEQTVSPSAPITETEVGEYREQDRVLPVSRPQSPLVEPILTFAGLYFTRSFRCEYTPFSFQCPGRLDREAAAVPTSRE
jgi:hypothetical protein